jgi:signal transduction histidine kinase
MSRLRSRYSLRHRLLRTILALEIVLALGMSSATLLYTHHEQLHAFDLMIRGRADSLLGAVQDSEDDGDQVMVNLHALDLRREDVWQVMDEKARVLAQSAQWSQAYRETLLRRSPHSFTVQGQRYRGVVLHGVRQIDDEDGNPGIARPVTIFYIAPLAPVHAALRRAGQFLFLANAILLLLTWALLAALLKRGLAPLEHLNWSAAKVNPAQPLFLTPPDAAGVKELAALAATLESATQRLNQSFRQQQVFLHDAAHELKTDVTLIKSSLQLLTSRSRTRNEYEQGLRRCLGDCERMEELVQRMLQLANFEQQQPLQTAACNLTEAACEVTTQMEHLAETREVVIAVEAPESATVSLSGDACSTLLSNLLLNALQHTPAGGRVAIAIAPVDESIELRVQDTGSGIAAADLPHVFERFYRGDRSRSRATGGSGLGLAICKAIVESCGGTISIRSQLGAGTCVEAKLPRVGDAAGQHAPTLACQGTS